MIIGKIDDNLEARIELQVISGEKSHGVEFLVDTGFNGYLALPMSLVSSLELPLGEVQRGITADGRIGFFDTVRVPMDRAAVESIRSKVLHCTALLRLDRRLRV